MQAPFRRQIREPARMERRGLRQELQTGRFPARNDEAPKICDRLTGEGSSFRRKRQRQRGIINDKPLLASKGRYTEDIPNAAEVAIKVNTRAVKGPGQIGNQSMAPILSENRP